MINCDWKGQSFRSGSTPRFEIPKIKGNRPPAIGKDVFHRLHGQDFRDGLESSELSPKDGVEWRTSRGLKLESG